MTTITQSTSSRTDGHSDRHLGFFAEVRAFWRLFFVRAFDPYRPELHYMRGPGPAWRAKHVPSSHIHST